MLKPRSAYGSTPAFNIAFFKAKATIHSFVLNPELLIQIKILINNKNTKHLGLVDRFVICNNDGTSKMFYKEDAIEILQFLESIKKPTVKTLAMSSEEIHYQNGDKSFYNIPSIRARISGTDVKICGWRDTMLVKRRDNDSIQKEFLVLIDRFSSIMKEFLNLVDGNDPVINEEFNWGRFLMVPLNNQEHGFNSPISLTLQSNHANIINLSGMGGVLAFYKRGQNSDITLGDICEGFIDSIYRVIDDFNAPSWNVDNINDFRTVYPVILSEDRKMFMEYVGARGMSVPNGDDPIKKGMVFQLNSDATVTGSKIHFRYDPQFINDLVDKLRFLYEYKSMD